MLLQATPLLLGLLVLLGLVAAPASAAEKRPVNFDGRTLEVPAAWPVYRLDRHPRMCARLDRKAVYLGTPSARQDCPAEAIGRRRGSPREPPPRGRSPGRPRGP